MSRRREGGVCRCARTTQQWFSFDSHGPHFARFADDVKRASTPQSRRTLEWSNVQDCFQTPSECNEGDAALGAPLTEHGRRPMSTPRPCVRRPDGRAGRTPPKKRSLLLAAYGPRCQRGSRSSRTSLHGRSFDFARRCQRTLGPLRGPNCHALGPICHGQVLNCVSGPQPNPTASPLEDALRTRIRDVL
jgi:hypothetical protein